MGTLNIINLVAVIIGIITSLIAIVQNIKTKTKGKGWYIALIWQVVSLGYILMRLD